MRFDFARTVCASLSLFFVAGCGGGDASDPVPGGGRVEDRIVYTTNYFSSRNEDGTVPAQAFTRIYTVNPDGSGQKRLLAGTESYDSSPSFSPDGSRIVFLSDRENCGGGCRKDDSGYGKPLQVWVMNSDGSRPRRMTGMGEGSDITDPVFSPDGSRILFTASRAIWSLGEEGGEPVRIVQGRTYRKVSVSPDGSKILYWVPEVRNPSTFIANADGTGETRLADNAYESSFSPDGSRIVYTRDDFVGPGGYAYSIWVMNADGTGKTRLTNDTYANRSPAFSPEGTMIAFQRDDGSLAIMKADGTGQQSVAIIPEPSAGFGSHNTLGSRAWALTRAE